MVSMSQVTMSILFFVCVAICSQYGYKKWPKAISGDIPYSLGRGLARCGHRYWRREVAMATKWLQTLPRKASYSPVGYGFWAQSGSDSQGTTCELPAYCGKTAQTISRKMTAKSRQIRTKIVGRLEERNETKILRLEPNFAAISLL